MAKTKKAPVEEVEETEDEELELEELDEDAEADEAPAKGKAKGGQPEVTFGASDLAKHLSKKTGKTITPRELRTLIRKMAREDKPRIDREITAGNRSRYDWPDGLNDPEVKAIIKAVTGGELEANKKEALQKLKDQKAAKKAAGEATGKKGKKGKSKPAPEPEDDVEEIDEDELEDDEE